AQDLVAARFRADELGIVAIKLEQRLLVLGQAEEPGLLSRPLDGRALGRELLPALPLDELAFVVESLVAPRIPTLVAVEIKVPGRLHRFPDGDACALVARLGGAHEIIVRDV